MEYTSSTLKTVVSHLKTTGADPGSQEGDAPL